MASTQVTINASSASHPSSTVHFDSAYPRSLPGILKIVECIVNICAFITMTVFTSQYIFAPGRFYEFVSISACIISLTLFIFYLFHFNDSIVFIPWLLAEIIFSLLWSVLYFIAGGIVTAYASRYAALAAASFFAFVAAVLYVYEACSKFVIRRSQGEIRANGTSG